MTNFTIDRRGLLLAASAAGLSACGPFAGPPPKVGPVDATTSVIDIHCHVFNARDLPISGFADSIYISASPGLLRYSEEVIVSLIRFIMDGQAPSAEEEIAILNGGSAPVHAVADDPFADDFSHDSNGELLRQHVTDAMVKLQHEMDLLRSGPPVHTPEGEAAALVANKRADDRLNLMNDLASHSPNPTHSVNPDQPPPPAAIADGVVRSFKAQTTASTIAGVLWMATLMTRPRRELVRRLFGLPSEKGGDVKFLAPALVDYGYWLDDRTNVTTLDKQIDVMSAIAAHPPTPDRAVHAWISFCPWRQIAEPGQADLVKQAVLAKGMLGLKLYPVMGFYPIGNEQAQARGERYNWKLEAIADFGKKMDAALRDLYRFCVDNDVPLLAHCSHSEYPHLFGRNGDVNADVDLGMRGSPAGWEKVLQEFPTLRLNIGHAGGLWDLSLHPDHPPANPLWTEKVVELVATYPNTYADISDYSTIYDSDQADDGHILGLVKGYLDRYPAARGKLMYGTDWEMLSMTLGAENYYPQMRRLIALDLGLDATQTAGFFGVNAATLTGLRAVNGNKLKTRQRLEVFYEAHQLDKNVLALFDA